MKKSQPLTKNDFEKILYGALVDQSQSIIEAVDFGFGKASIERKKIQNKLDNLERRIIFLEDKAAEHSKDLKKIKSMIKKLQEQKKIGQKQITKIASIEVRLGKLEAKVT